MTLSGTYADFDRFAILSQSFDVQHLPTPELRRKYFKEFHNLCEYMESLDITKEYDKLADQCDKFHAENTNENGVDPERVATAKLLNEQANVLQTKKSEVPVSFTGFSKENWEAFKSSYDKAATKLPQYQSAKALSVIDEWVAMVDEVNKK